MKHYQTEVILTVINGEAASSIDDFAVTWRAIGDVTLSEHVVRLREANSEMLLFRDGRALIKGTADLGRARSIYSRLIGS